ncbi:tyrosine-type recombinase/integrase [Corynebacterium gallinarum]|uniref:Tyrosine-type recombinase/integrase n=1 Tax=Corynebacterium gallinarum TaxID=2762214 RepID=A0A8I0HR32_9CORY|nr:tyrosine-type recombinase/integrase [Corynebacterium gallinarum]MBD8030285.1 tyrosine-type recombinase/integrase [Corynebacterium gallinarum]
MARKKVRTRRAFGAIEELKSGRYRARYRHPETTAWVNAPNTFPAKIDAEGWLADERRLIDLGTWISPEERERRAELEEIADSNTVRVCMDQWLNDKERQGLKASTMTKYRERVAYRITAEGLALADMPVSEVTSRAVREWWDDVQQRWPDSGELNRKAYQHLRSAFDDLVDDEVIPVNPVVIRASKRTVKPKMEKNLPTLLEQQAIYSEAPERYKLITLLTQFHGLRIGEALALKRQDITVKSDLTKGPGPWSPLVHASVHDNLQRVKRDGKWVMEAMGSAKTAQGNRRVPILSMFHKDLFLHMEKFTGPHREELLTTTRTGSAVFDTAFRSTFNGMLKRAGITRRLHPHAGRRFIVSALLEQGYEPTAVGQIIGDKDLKVVLEIYAQVRDGRTEEIMTAWSRSWQAEE